MRIHREGYPLLATLAGILFLANVAAVRRLPRSLSRGIAVASALTFGFFARFFRDPVRVIPVVKDGIIAPADGTVVALERVREGEYFCDERLKLSIYMSALNVHVNRVPVTGEVVYTKYHPGKYLVAFHPKASELNERNTCVIETPDGKRLLIRQIAGILARRIVFYPNIGQTVQAGDELGFIKLGSRCDVFLPLDCSINVQMGQKVKGGETVLAEWTSK
jgi:phosphatidylserine decarboxylase